MARTRIRWSPAPPRTTEVFVAASSAKGAISGRAFASRRVWLLVLAPLLLVVAFQPFTYFFAMHEDERCLASATPGVTSQHEIEACLSLFVTSTCADDNWYPTTYRRKDRACANYKILGVAPLYVIYDSSHRLIAAFPAYE